MSQFVRLLSNENDTVMDPFMGSGSSGEAALILKRNFIGYGNQRRLLPDKQRTTFITWGAKK